MADGPEETSDAERDQIVLGLALRKLRDRAGLTQERLATRIGVDVTYVSQVERGRRGVRWHTVLRFLRALDASLAELVAALGEDGGARGRKAR
jgi:transcriptional regulator with XRE-family HTH domain